MSDKFLVISGYTIGSKYEDEIKDLERGLNEFRHEFKFYPYECKGDWVKNTMEKSRLMWEAINSTKKDILWIDADAVVKGSLSMFNYLDEVDISFRYHVNPAVKSRNTIKDNISKIEGGNIELLSGTLWFKNNEISKKLIYNWMISCNGSQLEWDQRILQRIFESAAFKGTMKHHQLSEDYVKIKGRGSDINAIGGIIRHKQLSRSERPKLKSAVTLNTLGCQIIEQGDRFNKIVDLFHKGHTIPQVQKILNIPTNPVIVSDLQKIRGYTAANPPLPPLTPGNDKRISNLETYVKEAETFDGLRDYLHDKNILVIGNSSRILTQDNSKLIDSFDCVIRINFGSPQKNTGNKTHLWAYQHPLNREDIDRVINTYESMKPDKIIRFAFSKNTNSFVKFPNMYIGRNSQELERFYSGNYVNEKGVNTKRSPSTGVRVFDLLCKQFDCKNVSAIGFDGFASGTWYHAKNDYGSLGRAACHDPSFEKDLFHRLEKSGSVDFYDEFGRKRKMFY